jgi:adenosylcobinamide-GDP ribazoletransferase
MAELRASLDLFARNFALAVQRVTVLRGATPGADDPEALRASDAHLPGAGWIVGIGACLAFALMGVVLRGSPFNNLVGAVAATALAAALTRGRGETALFRMVESLQGPAAPGHSGAGTLVLVFVLAAKFSVLAALGSLSEAGVIATLFAAHAVSRLAPLLLARSLDGDVPPRAVQFGALWCVLPLLLMVPAAGVASLLVAVVAAALACYGMWRLARRQAEPADRDLLAGTQQVCEVAFYLGAALAL